jgi:hypothetical protein
MKVFKKENHLRVCAAEEKQHVFILDIISLTQSQVGEEVEIQVAVSKRRVRT